MKTKSFEEQRKEILAECDKKGIPYLDDMGKGKMPEVEDKTIPKTVVCPPKKHPLHSNLFRDPLKDFDDKIFDHSDKRIHTGG